MKIAVCDDSIEDLLKLEKLLLKYKIKYPTWNLELEKYSDSSRLYRKIMKGELADIYILDMLMPGHNGVELGTQIRNLGCGSVIIYVTSSDDYALDAYGVHAVRYLIKPVDEDGLFEALNYALACLKVKKEPEFLLKTKGGLVRIPYSRIEYIENASRKLEVHVNGEEVLKSLFIRKSFEEEIQEIVEKKNFMQVHKSFLVNLDYVKRLTADGLIMESGVQLPVSKAKAAQVKREYLLFVSGKCR